MKRLGWDIPSGLRVGEKWGSRSIHCLMLVFVAPRFLSFGGSGHRASLTFRFTVRHNFVDSPPCNYDYKG